MRILLVDDHALFRDGLKWLLSGLGSDLHFAEADSLESFAEVAKQDSNTFDIVLLDLYLPDSDGLRGLQLAQQLLPDAATVVLSSRDEPQLINAAMESGAAGFIPKSSTREVLIAALQLVLAGGVYVPPRALHGYGTNAGHSPDSAAAFAVQRQQYPVLEHLTPRQRDVLELAVEGNVNKVIARDLGISEATVKAHLSAGFRALGVKNRTEASFKAAEIGLFT